MLLCLVKKKPMVYFNAICSTTVGTAVMESICASLRCAVQSTVGHLSERIIQSAIAAELRRNGIDVQEQVTQGSAFSETQCGKTMRSHCYVSNFA